MSDNENTQNTASSTEDVQKSSATPSEIELLTTLVKNQNTQIAAIQKDSSEKFDTLTKTLEDLKKQQDANPVDHGTSKEEKPKVEDADDVGDAPKDDPSYAPDGDAQASIRAPADEAPKSDSVKVSKSDDEEKKDDKESKSEDKEDKVEKSVVADLKKSVAPDGFEYEIVKSERPVASILPVTPQGAPTGYQVMKAIFNGWGGKHTNIEKSFIEGYERLLKGEFGSGTPGGY